MPLVNHNQAPAVRLRTLKRCSREVWLRNSEKPTEHCDQRRAAPSIHTLRYRNRRKHPLQSRRRHCKAIPPALGTSHPQPGAGICTRSSSRPQCVFAFWSWRAPHSCCPLQSLGTIHAGTETVGLSGRRDGFPAIEAMKVDDAWWLVKLVPLAESFLGFHPCLCNVSIIHLTPPSLARGVRGQHGSDPQHTAAMRRRGLYLQGRCRVQDRLG